MSVFKFELRSIYKQAIIWAISLCAIFFAFSFLFPVYKSAATEITKVLAAYPKAFVVALGIDLTNLFSLNGFFAFYSTYILLTASIMALNFGITIFSREKKTKTSDFLLTKPISRTRIFVEKCAAGAVCLLAVNALFVGFLQLMYMSMDHAGASNLVFMLITLSIVIIEFVMYSLGIVLAITMRKIKSPSSIATSVGFGFFIISMMYGIIGENWLRYLTPLKYFDLNYVMVHQSYEISWLILSVAVFALALTYSCIAYIKQDIPSV